MTISKNYLDTLTNEEGHLLRKKLIESFNGDLHFCLIIYHPEKPMDSSCYLHGYNINREIEEAIYKTLYDLKNKREFTPCIQTIKKK